MNARNERPIDDEVGARGPADGLDRAGAKPKRQRAVDRF
jgi:hypothetical protein